MFLFTEFEILTNWYCSSHEISLKEFFGEYLVKNCV